MVEGVERRRLSRTFRLSLDVQAQMASMAKRAGVKTERRDYPMVFLYAEDLGVNDPEMLRCIDAMLDEMNTPPRGLQGAG